ncbi:sigma factor-like helix-turn-helix DNA-binding protein [Kribbella turkmenica]|uniref:sigma factor-like helix-turn-helix DNA-binding protein n=1 Tax=Kribbella turkmenica TaxID=2530375 RepID=UPI001F306045|nr:sigma factor-like helix-turn-helix DNA-binding protein [Kribbella turkmenica]
MSSTSTRLVGRTRRNCWRIRIVDNDSRDALADLPPEYRVAVLLRDIDGLSNKEVAPVLDIKPGTVGSRLHRGRARLRAALAHRAPPLASRGGLHA